MHEVGPDEAGEGQWTAGGLGGCLRQAQQQIGDQGHGDLDTDGVLASAEEVFDLEGLFDPAEEQLDGPAAFVEVGDLLGGSVQVVGGDPQLLAVLEHHADLPQGVLEGVLAAFGHAFGQVADVVVKQG